MANNNPYGLTDKQIAFCEEYLVDFNGTQAAIRAGYSKRSANRIASENLSKPDISNYLGELTKQKIENSDTATPEEILEHLTNTLRGNITDFVELIEDEITIEEPEFDFSEDEPTTKKLKKQIVCIKDINNLPLNKTGIIQEIHQTRDGIKLKLYSKDDAVDKLMKYYGMFEKDNEQKKQEPIEGFTFIVKTNE